MKTFLIRSVSGLVYAGLIIGSILAGPVTFSVLMLLFLVMGLWELYAISRKSKIYASLFPFYFFPLTIYLIAALVIHQLLPVSYLGICIGFFFFALIFQLFERTDHLFERTTLPLFGILYLAIPLLILNTFFYVNQEAGETDVGILIGLFFLIWINDTFAYITGSLFGRNKLFKKLSPNKTWEGSIGGLAFSLLGGYVFFIILEQYSLTEWLIMSALVVIFGTFGDLFESMMKRYAGIKESGNLIPGHGGILDRIDSILFATPFVFIYFYFVIH